MPRSPERKSAPQASSFAAALRLVLPKPPATSQKVRSALAVILLASAAASAALSPISYNPLVLTSPQIALLSIALFACLMALVSELSPKEAVRSWLTTSSPSRAFLGAFYVILFSLRYLLLPAYAALLVLSLLYARQLSAGLLVLPALGLTSYHLMRD